MLQIVTIPRNWATSRCWVWLRFKRYKGLLQGKGASLYLTSNDEIRSEKSKELAMGDVKNFPKSLKRVDQNEAKSLRQSLNRLRHWNLPKSEMPVKVLEQLNLRLKFFDPPTCSPAFFAGDKAESGSQSGDSVIAITTRLERDWKYWIPILDKQW